MDRKTHSSSHSHSHSHLRLVDTVHDPRGGLREHLLWLAFLGGLLLLAVAVKACSL